MVVERIGDRPIDLQSRVDATKKTPAEEINQFEAVFLQTMFKSNCIDEHFAHESNSFISPIQCELPIALNRAPIASEETTVETTPDIKQTQLNPSIDEFVKSIWPYARVASTALGLKPELLIAQVALETGWGQFVAKDEDGTSSNNLFNIKSNSTDASVTITTTEYLDKSPVKVAASFKKYSSVDESFKDYISLINGDRYKVALANVHDPERYVNALHQAGYATDPNYANKVLSIYHGEELKRALEKMVARLY